jgi:hypothetical protein
MREGEIEIGNRGGEGRRRKREEKREEIKTEKEEKTHRPDPMRWEDLKLLIESNTCDRN